MGFLRQPRQRQRLQAFSRERVWPLGDRHVERIGRPPQPAHAGDGLTRRCAGADLRSAVRKGDAPVRRELHLGQAGFRPVAETALDAAETDPVIFSGMGRVVDLLAREAAGP
jgi:hypothetical protein